MSGLDLTRLQAEKHMFFNAPRLLLLRGLHLDPELALCGVLMPLQGSQSHTLAFCNDAFRSGRQQVFLPPPPMLCLLVTSCAPPPPSPSPYCTRKALQGLRHGISGVRMEPEKAEQERQR